MPPAGDTPRARAAPWLIAVAFAAVALVAVRRDVFLHDEGILTYLFSRWVLTAGSAALFFLKVKPALCLMNLPGALGGLDAFLVWHALLTALAVPLAGDIARRGRLGPPWLAALVVAASPMFLASCAAGLSNADGVLAALVAIRLAQDDRPGARLGAALCALPLVRFELGMLSAMLLVDAARRRPAARFWAGLALPAALYGVAGAIYHRDLLWPWHFAPAWGDVRGKNPVVMSGVDRLTLGQMLDALACTSPAFALALLVRPPVGRALAWTLAAFGAAFTAFTMVTPFARALFGFAPRYYLIALAPFAFAAPLALERLAREARPAERWASVALVALAAAGAYAAGAAWCAAAAAGGALAAAVAAAGQLTAARALLAALVVAWPLAARPTMEVVRAGQDSDPAPVVRWLRAHRDRWEGRPVYTNMQLLDAYARRSGRLPGLDVRYIVQTDSWREVRGWTNPRNGQTARMEASILREIYGRGARIEEILEGRAPAGALVLILPDPRLVPEGAERRWEARVEPFATIGPVEAARVRRP